MILNETKLRIYARKIKYEVKTLSLVFNDEGYLGNSYIDSESRFVPPRKEALGIFCNVLRGRAICVWIVFISTC